MVQAGAGSPRVGGEFALTDHFGQPVTSASYRGSFALIFFGFTRCKVVCPRALTRISGALDRLGTSAKAVQPLYITVDPDRDSPAILRAFLEERFPRFIGLTGTRDEIEAVKTAYRVFARKLPDLADTEAYDVAHSAMTYLLDPEGNYCTHYPDTVGEEKLAEMLLAVVSGHSGDNSELS